MLKSDYRKLIKLLKVYLDAEGIKRVHWLSPDKTPFCDVCKKPLAVNQYPFNLSFSGRVVLYYMAMCSSCRIAYLHKTIEIEELEE